MCGQNTRVVHTESSVSIKVLHCRVSVTNITGLFDCRVYIYLTDLGLTIGLPKGPLTLVNVTLSHLRSKGFAVV